MARILAIVVAAFKLWMFIDAVRSKAPEKWLWTIILMPGGSLIYFFMVKIRDPSVKMLGNRMLASIKSPPSVEALETLYRRTPSLGNRVQLAQRLFDAGRLEEALAHFEGVLAKKPDDKEGLYGLGLTRLEIHRQQDSDPSDAIEPLERLITVHRGYRDYAAWPELAEALWVSGDKNGCHALLDDLVRAAPRLAHEVLRAKYLIRASRRHEATVALRRALEEESHQPRHIRRANRALERDAKAMLQSTAAE